MAAGGVSTFAILCGRGGKGGVKKLHRAKNCLFKQCIRMQRERGQDKHADENTDFPSALIFCLIFFPCKIFLINSSWQGGLGAFVPQGGMDKFLLL